MRGRLAALAAACAAAGCTVGPDYRPPAAIDGTGAPQRLVEAADPAFLGDPPPGDWWRLYADPRLDALVRRALVRNTDLRAALATLEAAQASLRATELQRTPQTDFSGTVTYGQSSADTLGAPSALSPGPLVMLSEAVSYNVDLFGRIRRGIEAGAADVEASRAALDLARVNVAAGVVGAYASACSAGLQIAVVNRSLGIARDIVSVTDRRFRGGISGINDTVRARTLYHQTEANLPNLVAQQRAALYLLATLTGDPPSAFPADVATCTAPPVLRMPLPVGDGSSLLRRRPDVRAADRRLAGSVAAIGIATASLYPTVSLGGTIGTTATSFRDIVRDRAFTWNVGPLVSWTFPNIAIARANIVQAGAVARGDLARFDGTVLTALRETDTAMSALARQLDTERALARARDDARTAAANTERLYAGGVGEFLDTLDAERTFIQAENTLAAATATVAQRQVSLFMALGGGWQDAPAVEQVPLDAVAVPHAKRRGPVKPTKPGR